LIRFASFAAMLLVWAAAAHFSDPRYLPGPGAVATKIWEIGRNGELFDHLSITLARVGAAFALAMSAGSILGFVMGRSALANEILDPWLIVLLNLPALVIIVIAFIDAGLTEAAAIGAVALNKLPGAIVLAREGARTLDPALEEMAAVFRLPFKTRLRHIVAPQLAPYLVASARSGLSLVWKIVLVVELLGRPNGIGYEISLAFQQSVQMQSILAYSIPFIAIMLAVETLLVAPLERYVSRWRPHAARRFN